MTKKIKLSLLSSLIAVLLSPVIAPLQSARAAGGVMWPTIRLSANTTEPKATGSPAVTITVTSVLFQCNDVDPNGNHYVYDSPEDCDTYNDGGLKQEIAFDRSCSDFTITLQMTGEDAIPSRNTLSCANGDTFTMKSSVVGTKTVKAVTTWPYSSFSRTSNVLTLNFGAAPAPVTTKPKTVAPTPTPTPAPAAPVVEKPAVPTVTGVLVGGQTQTTDKPLSVATDKPLVLNGKTVPGGKVALWIFSEPKLYETTADSEGNWTVTVTGLPAGSHHAEIEVTNPANNQKSERTKLLDFKVVSAQKAATTTAATVKRQSSKTGFVGAGLLVLVALTGGFLLWRRKKSQSKTAGSASAGDVYAPATDSKPDANSADSSDDKPGSPQTF